MSMVPLTLALLRCLLSHCRLKSLPLYGLGVSSGASFVLRLPRFFKASDHGVGACHRRLQLESGRLGSLLCSFSFLSSFLSSFSFLFFFSSEKTLGSAASAATIGAAVHARSHAVHAPDAVQRHPV